MWQIISDFIGNILIVIGVLIFSRMVLDKPICVTKKRLVMDILLSAVIYTIVMLRFDSIVKTILFVIIMLCFNKDVFKKGNKKSLFLTIMYTLILLVLDVFFLFFVTTVLNMSKDYCYNVFAGSIICNFFVQILIVTLTFLLKKILKNIINNKISTNNKIIIFSILILICSMSFLYTIVREFQFNDNVVLYLVSIIVLLTVLFSLIKQMIDNNRLTSEYDKLLEFMTTYETEIENQRILRHEVKNEFRTIRAKISDNQENKEIIEYIDEIVNDKYEVNKEKYAKFGYLPPNGIKGLCYFKTQEAEGKGIKVSLNISKRIKNSTIYSLNVKQQRDFGRILGVFLDNAIEASVETKEKQVGIEAYVNAEQEFKLIISNTYNNKIDKEKIGIESFSTKGKNRGHGLLLVKQLVNKNDIFKIRTSLENNLYIQTIEIKKL